MSVCNHHDWSVCCSGSLLTLLLFRDIGSGNANRTISSVPKEGFLNIMSQKNEYGIF